MKKFTFLLIFGFMSVMIHVVNASDEMTQKKYRRHATPFGLRKISGISDTQGEATILSRLNVKRFKRQEEKEETPPEKPEAPGEDVATTQVPAESEAPKKETATKVPAEPGSDAPVEGTTSPVTDSEKTEDVTGPAGLDAGNAAKAAVEEASKNMTSALPQNGSSTDAKSPINIKDDIQDIILSSVKLVVDIAKNAHNTATQVSQGIANKAMEIKGNVDRTVKNVGGSIFGTTLNITQGLAEKIGFGRIIPGVLEMGKT